MAFAAAAAPATASSAGGSVPSTSIKVIAGVGEIRSDPPGKSTIPLRAQTSWDVAPAILDILGFPASSEMPGGTSTSRIASYGPRAGGVETVTMNEEYYENLKSLGYIR